MAPVAEGRGWERASNGEKSLLPPDFAEQPVGQRVKTVAGIAGKQIAQGLAGVGDMLLGIPGAAVQTLAGGVYDVAGSLASLKSGQTSKQVLSQASEMARNIYFDFNFVIFDRIVRHKIPLLIEQFYQHQTKRQ